MTTPIEEDARRLAEQLDVRVDLVHEGQQVFVILRAVALPPHLIQPRSDVLLIADVQYPHSAMDMFWLESTVVLKDRELPSYASSIETYAGREWRRWSWHRNGRWTPGVDDILSHWEFVEACWAQEAAA